MPPNFSSSPLWLVTLSCFVLESDEVLEEERPQSSSGGGGAKGGAGGTEKGKPSGGADKGKPKPAKVISVAIATACSKNRMIDACPSSFLKCDL